MNKNREDILDAIYLAKEHIELYQFSDSRRYTEKLSNVLSLIYDAEKNKDDEAYDKYGQLLIDTLIDM